MLLHIRVEHMWRSSYCRRRSHVEKIGLLGPTVTLGITTQHGETQPLLAANKAFLLLAKGHSITVMAL